MNENKFEELLLDRLEKIDNRFDKIDNRLDKMDERIMALDNKIDERTTALESRFSNVEQTTSWIKGKLEGRSEVHHVVLTGISIVVAIGAVIVAIFK